MTVSSSPSPLTAAWTGVEHRHLASLAAVARARSFRGAARDLRCSQSVVSQHVAQLERMVGVRLAERRRGRSEVELTPEGEALMRHVGPILAIYRAAEADLGALAADGPGLLRLGVGAHLVATLPALVLPAFLNAVPGVEVELVGGADPDLLATALRDGALDVVVADPPADAAGLEMTLLAPESYMLVAPAAWAVVARGDATTADLLEHLPVTLDGADPDAARVARELLAGGRAPRSEAPAASQAMLLAQVAAGRTAAILPAGAVPADARLVARPLDGLVAPRPLAVLRQSARRHAPLVDAFIAAVVAARGRARDIAPRDRPVRGSAFAAAGAGPDNRRR
jgi:DNA-binding transcriptional LysR family regulator